MRRRRFLAGLGATALLPPVDRVLGALAPAGAAPSPFSSFQPVAPTIEDDVVVPEGFVYDVVVQWGDPLTAAGETFGYNNDFIGVFPLSSEEVLLVVNHEYVSLAEAGDAPLYPQSFRMLRGRTPTVADYKADVGVSVVRVRRDGGTGAWRAVPGDRVNRRITATTPCAVDGPAAGLMRTGRVEGTFENCSGGVTPWGTALSCEENYQNRVPDGVDADGNYPAGGMFDLPGGHYGWVVEVDPFDPGRAPVKHTALGRFRHENVGLRAEPGQRVAAYMGDDRAGGHVWKFVSDGTYRPGDAAECRRLLASGRLFAARFHADGTGEWRELAPGTALDPNPAPDASPAIPAGARTLGDCYRVKEAMVIDAYRAANAIGASPAGRPEDLEVHPADGSVFIAFTMGNERLALWPNVYGEVWRLVEEDGDVGARRFRWSRFAVGAADPARPGRTFTQPDNLMLDAHGDLWVACDIPSGLVNAREDYHVFRNPGLFRIPVTGTGRGAPEQFASFPCECEPTGPAWAPGEHALFVSVQHPGERHGTRLAGMAPPRGSNWPSRKPGEPPRPAVVAIRRR